MYRSIEIGHTKCEDITFNGSDTSVSVRLSASKTDYTGRGFRFRWRCICGGQDSTVSRMTCPYHCLLEAAIIMHDFVIKNFPATVGGTEHFFKRKSGDGIVTSQIITAYLNKLHEALPEGIGGDDHFLSDERFSGHSVRRSGAQHWTRAKLSESLIRRLARWKSDAIERYLQSVPCEDLGPELLFGEGAEHAVEVGRLLSEVRSLLAAHENKKKQEAAAGLTGTTQVIVSRNPHIDSKVHSIKKLNGYNETWVTGCGWRFGSSMAICEMMDASNAQSSKIPICTGRGCWSSHFMSRYNIPDSLQ